MPETSRPPRIIRLLAATERLVIGGLMAAITFLTLIQVLWRYGFNHPLTWSEEVARYCFVWVTFIGAATLLRLSDGHPELDTLRNRAGPFLRHAIDVFSRIMVIVCCIAISVGGVRMIETQFYQESPSVGIPMWMMYLSMAVTPLIGVFWVLWRAKFGSVEDGS